MNSYMENYLDDLIEYVMDACDYKNLYTIIPGFQEFVPVEKIGEYFNSRDTSFELCNNEDFESTISFTEIQEFLDKFPVKAG